MLGKPLEFNPTMDQIRRAATEVGGVIAGDFPTFRVDRMPYGGVKESGAGREGLRWAIRVDAADRSRDMSFDSWTQLVLADTWPSSRRLVRAR